MSSAIQSAQDLATSALENAGFECVSNFADPCDYDGDSRVYVYSRKRNSFSSDQAEVDASGMVNGQAVADYLAQH